jgi:PAS domain S-box-containing protein
MAGVLGWITDQHDLGLVVLAGLIGFLACFAVTGLCRRRAHPERTAEDSAERAQALLRDIVDSLPEGLVIYDPDDRLVLCNEAYRRSYSEAAEVMVEGNRFEDIMRARLAEGLYPDAKGREEAWLAERTRDHRDPKGTKEIELHDGRWVLVCERRMRNGGIAGLRIDITALKAVQAELRASEERLVRAQRIAGVGSAEHEVMSGATVWSPEAYEICGLDSRTFKPGVENLLNLVHPDDQDKLRAMMRDLQKDKTHPPVEYRIIRPDGEIRHLYREHEVVADRAGRPVRVASTIKDVTELRALQQRERELERELRQSQKIEAIGNLSGGIAHDFNNLLGVVIGNLDLLSLGAGRSEDDKALLADALAAALRGSELTQLLLAFGRRQPLRSKREDVNELLRSTTDLLQRTLGANIEIVHDFAADLRPAEVDPAQLEVAITNLATNARDAMPDGGKLTFRTANVTLDETGAARHPDMRVGAYVVIAVCDTGTGMSPETLARIFDPFFTTKEVGKGSGLGLSMVFGFTKQSGGHIDVASEPGKGTSFRLYLPSAPADELAGSKRTGSATILVVEDNDGLRRVVVRQLAQLGYEVVEARDAASALEILRAGSIDLLFTDMVMPGAMDGSDLARAAATLAPGVKVLFTSGFPAAAASGGVWPGGGATLLGKPYRREELASAVRAALASPAGSLAPEPSSARLETVR